VAEAPQGDQGSGRPVQDCRRWGPSKGWRL